MTTSVEIAIVGAGIAGLTCAQQLHRAGHSVVVLDKSRGVGGRVATRRLHGTCADHGTCYLSPPKDDRARTLLEDLIAANVVQVWTDTVHELDDLGLHALLDRTPRYVASSGMTAIAKFLAADLDIHLSQRVQSVTLLDTNRWQLTTDSGDVWVANAVVIAIPAPQAALLVQPLTEVLSVEWVERVQAVDFLPCLSVMAGYATRQQDWSDRYGDARSISVTHHPDLAWIGLDSSKRSTMAQPVFVIQSTAAFADRVLDAADLQPAGYELLQRAAEQLLPWLATPDWLQVHRWRYAFARSPLSETYLAAKTAAPFILTGDWCAGRKVENAYVAGLATAEHLLSHATLSQSA